MNDTSLMTVKETAAKVGVTIGAVYNRIESGQIGSVEKYGRILIPRREAEKWLLERVEAANKILEAAEGAA